MKTFALLSRFLRGDRAASGVAAAEFAIISPVFALAMLGMVDIGMAVNERMEMDRVLRAGVQEAMTGANDVAKIETAVQNANFSSRVNESPPMLSVHRTCFCSTVANSCNALCNDGAAPSVYFDLAAVQNMQTFLLPAMTIRTDMRVQVR